MKRISFISVILAIMLLSACGTPAVTEQPTPTTTPVVKSAKPAPLATFTVTSFHQSSELSSNEVPASATYTITSFHQDYYEYFNEWSPYVNIYYEIQNNGIDIIKYYKVYFTVTCEDGSKIQDWDNGTGLPYGYKVPDNTMAEVGKKKVVDVEITGFEGNTHVYESQLSKNVNIYYDVENTGNVYLANYKIYFTANCDDGSKYQGWATGSDVLVGQKWSTWTTKDVERKKVISVEITDWELTAGTAPKIIYEITGTADKVDVTLNNGTGGTEQYSNVSVPKKYTYSYFSDNFLYISAQNQGEYGTVRASIYVNGILYKTSSSSGAYVIASASGSK